MRFLIRPTLAAGKATFVFKAMSSLASGQILTGAKWNYHIYDALKGDGSHKSRVFKAEVIPKDAVHVVPDAPRWAFIKTATQDNETSVEELKFAAFEWLETTLQDVQSRPEANTYAMIGEVLRATLTSCAILAGKQLVNTDIKPTNILLSGVGTNNVIAKVGDLGVAHLAGSCYNAQPFAMRAPEVWLRQPCAEPSQIWAVAAMLLVWMKPILLGTSGCCPFFFFFFFFFEPWSIMKLMRLFPKWDVPPVPPLENDIRQSDFKVAKEWIDDPPPDQPQPKSLEDELRMLDTMAEIKDVLRIMLVVNPAERPSAPGVLASKEFLVLEEALAKMK